MKFSKFAPDNTGSLTTGFGMAGLRMLRKDPVNNIPLPEDQFSKVDDEQVSLRCNFRKVCKI
jgi:hypothetical protein